MAKAAPLLGLHQLRWLLAAASATLLPLLQQLPLWLTAFAGLLLLWRGWQLQKPRPDPAIWRINLLAFIAAAGVWLEYHQLIGQEPGTALLALFLLLKLFESRRARDAMVVLMLSLFLVMAQCFYDQTLFTALTMAFSTCLVLAAMAALRSSALPWPHQIRQSLALIGLALPLMLILFLFFPRIPGPLWGMSPKLGSATTGLSDSMSPGSISDLVKSDALAFRVRFIGPTQPSHDQLYWRGPVLQNFNDHIWSASGGFFRPPTGTTASTGTIIRYEMTLEAHNKPWLLALDYPIQADTPSIISDTFQLLAARPVNERLRYQARSSPAMLIGVDERDFLRKINLRLPGNNPRALALGQSLRQQHTLDSAIIDAMLQHFHDEPFQYTLSPSALGSNNIDEFLFQTRQGFCEHYAAAFVFVMRAAGIPARVVTGYLGGDINPVDGYLEVRQQDAHAWAEVWLKGKGWLRVDPTKAVAPNRVTDSLTASLSSQDAAALAGSNRINWTRQLRYRWAALNNQWNQWILGYNGESQLDLLKNLGFSTPDSRTLLQLLIGSALLAVSLLSQLLLRRSQALTAPQKIWQRFQQKFGATAYLQHPWEGPLEYAQRISASFPQAAKEIATIAALYAEYRYGPSSSTAAKEQLKTLRNRIKLFRPGKP